MKALKCTACFLAFFAGLIMIFSMLNEKQEERYITVTKNNIY